MRLLCDEMLARLARWLRAAGHDTALAGAGEPDAALHERARAERRLLVTRDRALAGRSAGLLLRAERPDGQARELAQALGLDWLEAPFTRCLVDNRLLERAGEACLAALPERARDLPGPFRSCPECGRLYWPGSHYRRMLARLERWRAGG